MKKTRTLLVVALFVLCIAFSFGCDFVTANIESIQIENAPPTTFIQGETGALDAAIEALSIRVNFIDETSKVYSYDEGLFDIENFSVDNVGVFTATISYEGVSVSFEYQVIGKDSDKFAGGEGTETYPYLVSTAAQWNNIDLKTDNTEIKYFKLTNDIDFEGVIITPIGEISDDYKKIILDGAGFALRNVERVDKTDSGKYTGLFNLFAGSVLKNLDVYFASSEIDGPAALCYSTAGEGTIEFNNVTTYGYINSTYMGASNSAAFIAQSNRGNNNNHIINFEKCNNYTNILGGTVTYAGGFIGQVGSELKANCKVEFTNCYNYGYIEGATGESGQIYGCKRGGYTGSNFLYNNDIEKGEVAKLSDIFEQSENGYKLKDGTANDSKVIVMYTFGIKHSVNSTERFKIDLTPNNNVYTIPKFDCIVRDKAKADSGTQLDQNKYNPFIYTGEYTVDNDTHNAIFLDTANERYENTESVSGFTAFLYAYDKNGKLIGFKEINEDLLEIGELINPYEPAA